MVSAGFTTKKIVAHEKSYKKLSGCQIDRIEVDNVRLSIYSMTWSASKQKGLAEMVDLTRLLSLQVVKMQGLAWTFDSG